MPSGNWPKCSSDPEHVQIIVKPSLLGIYAINDSVWLALIFPFSASVPSLFPPSCFQAVEDDVPGLRKKFFHDRGCEAPSSGQRYSRRIKNWEPFIATALLISLIPFRWLFFTLSLDDSWTITRNIHQRLKTIPWLLSLQWFCRGSAAWRSNDKPIP